MWFDRKLDMFLVMLLTAVMLFFGSSIHTNTYEAEQKVEEYLDIDAELEFEEDAEKPNIYEQLEQEREEMFSSMYN